MRAILITAHNEAASLEAVIHNCRLWLPDICIMVVDNNSSDETADIARALGAKVSLCAQKGYSTALKHGYQWALSQGVTELVQMDADGQHPPFALSGLFTVLQECDWVIGSRHALGCSGVAERRLASALAGPILRHMTGSTIQDWSSGMWGLNTKALQLFVSYFPQPAMDANLRIFALQQGLMIKEHPVAMHERQGGHSMHAGFNGSLNLLKSAWYAGRALRQ